jgi:hypothetical protein
MKVLPYWKVSIYTLSFGCLVSFSSYLYGRIDQIRNLSDLEKEILIIDINNRNEFTQDKLVTMLKDLNVRFPHIVVAQARLETGGYNITMLIMILGGRVYTTTPFTKHVI